MKLHSLLAGFVFFALLTPFPSLPLLAQSFDPKVKDLTTISSPTAQGLNDNFQPAVKDLEGKSDQKNTGSSQNNTATSNQRTIPSSPSAPINANSSQINPATSQDGINPSSPSNTLKAEDSASGKSPNISPNVFTCSRCGVEGATTKGYCLGNFGMLTDKNGAPYHHTLK